MSSLSTSSFKIPLAVENLCIFLVAGVLATRTGLNDLVKVYVWDPPGGLYTIISLVVVETIATAFLSPHVELAALAKRLGKFIAGYVLAFVIVHYLNKYDPTTIWMRPGVMNGSAALHFLFLLRALGKLGFMRPEVATDLQRRGREQQQLPDELPETTPGHE